MSVGIAALLVGCGDSAPSDSSSASNDVAASCESYPVTTAAPLSPMLIPGTGEVVIIMAVDEAVGPLEFGEITQRVSEALVLSDPATAGMGVTYDASARLVLVYAPGEVAGHVATALLTAADEEPAITAVDGVRCS